MKRLFAALLLLGCGGVLSACAIANPVLSLAPTTTVSAPSDYVKQVRRWTRHGDTIYDFDAALIVDATFHAPEFQAAFDAKYIHAYRVNENARTQVLAKLDAAANEGYVFHVETSSHTYELGDIKPPKTIWRTTLIDDKGREVSASVISQDRTRPEVLTTFYPYIGIFSRAWRVVFPTALPDGTPLVGPDTKNLTLRIAGPPGIIELRWRFAP